jgi:hypothetical protein
MGSNGKNGNGKRKGKKGKRSKVTLDGGAGATPAVAASKLWRDIQDGVVDPTTLDLPTRRAVVLVTMNGDVPIADVASALGVSYDTVKRDHRILRRELGDGVLQTTFGELLGDLAHSADVCYARAMASGATGLAWKVKTDFVKLVAKLGLVQPASERREVEVAIDVTHRYRESVGLLADITVPALTGEVVRGDGSPRGRLRDIEGQTASSFEEDPVRRLPDDPRSEERESRGGSMSDSDDENERDPDPKPDPVSETDPGEKSVFDPPPVARRRKRKGTPSPSRSKRKR